MNQGEAIGSGDDIVICDQCQGTGTEPCPTCSPPFLRETTSGKQHPGKNSRERTAGKEQPGKNSRRTDWIAFSLGPDAR